MIGIGAVGGGTSMAIILMESRRMVGWNWCMKKLPLRTSTFSHQEWPGKCKINCLQILKTTFRFSVEFLYEHALNIVHYQATFQAMAAHYQDFHFGKLSFYLLITFPLLILDFITKF